MSNAQLYRQWVNEFLTIERFAEFHGFTLEEAQSVIDNGRIEHEAAVEAYKACKEARIERMRARASKADTIARENGLDLYGETKSGIPLGQPILVGHHSERRHRNALKRIEAKVRKGFEAGREAERLRERADAAETSRAIASDNPEATGLLIAKIARLKDERESLKKSGTYESWQLRNLGAEIRRLEKRLDGLARASTVFSQYELPSGIKVELVEGQVQVEFPWKPDEASRSVLKRAPLALKWSRYSSRWVRKHTETTASQYFQTSLKQALENMRAEVQL